jgi:hypothetical protein
VVEEGAWTACAANFDPSTSHSLLHDEPVSLEQQIETTS